MDSLGVGLGAAREEFPRFKLIELLPVTPDWVRSQDNRFHDGCVQALLQPDIRLLCTSKVSFGSFSTELVWTKRSLRSAMPPIATEFTRHDESSRSARARHWLVYSVTSSARASSVGGTSRLSAFAALRLITSSNLVGRITGRSAGFSPLRILPA